MVNVDFDKSRFTKKKGDYIIGPAAALTDPLLYSRTQDYKRKLSGQMRPLSSEDIFRIPKAAGYYAARKYDGEFAFLAFDGKEIIAVNPGGTVRVGLPCFEEAAKLLKKSKVDSALLAGEIYLPESEKKQQKVSQVSRILRSPSSEDQLRTLSLAVFDVAEFEDKAVTRVDDVAKLLKKWFNKGVLVHPAEHKVVDTVDAITKLFNEWVVKEGSEGLVLRHEQAGWYKVKLRHNIDAAIIGYSEGSSDERKEMLHDLLVAVMRDDGTFHEFARVGGGFTDEDRKTIAAEMRRRVVPSDYVAVNNDYVAYEMIEPGPVIEMSCLDMISETSKGVPINKMVLEWDGKTYTALSRMPIGSVISPQFVRIREDKEANVEDVNIRQLTAFIDVAEVETSARETAAPPSEVLERTVYTKVMAGRKMVRKLLLWKTNKEDTGEFPGYVVYLTDYSPNRQNPLERDIRVASTEKAARQMFDQLAKKNFVGGWEKLS